MSALGDAARQVDKAWCKGDIVQEAKAEEAGDRYCAVGALLHSLTLADGLYIDWELPAVGTVDDLVAMRHYRDSLLEDYDESDLGDLILEETAHSTIYNYINGTKEAKALAKVILENYRDRLSWNNPDGTVNDVAQRLYDEENYAALIYSFNDEKETTREEVVAMMEKADINLDSALFDDPEIDELVEEVKELINA